MNILVIANPLFSKPALQKYLLGKDDLVMNRKRYDDQYPIDGALDIESRTERHEVKSKQHGVATEAVHPGRTENSFFLSESDSE